MSARDTNKTAQTPDGLQQLQQLQQAAMEQWTTWLRQSPPPFNTTGLPAAMPAAAEGAGAAGEQAANFMQQAAAQSLQMWQQTLQRVGEQAKGSQFTIEPEALKQLQAEYMDQIGQLLKRETAELGDVLRSDKRFSSESWLSSSPAAATAALYKINASALQKMVEITQTDEKSHARLQFAVDQWLAATSPTNFVALNPEVQSKAIESQGQSIAKGLMNMWQDMQRGHISMTDEAQFEVGKNLAVTPGTVVFENEFFQLLEYTPSTAKVFERPLLLVPPCINKYYILDLQPGNSLVEYVVAQGHRTFVVSWRNPDASMDTKTWDDYIEHGAIRAIEAVREISASDTINTLGFCVGGTILCTALGVLAARKKHIVESATLLTTLVDFADTGVLDIFIDENVVRFREMQMGQKGLMKGQDLAATFSFLRPNELVWNYVVGNYLKGETPPPFDLLYWNSDGTNLPGPFYAWYLRNTYLENNLIKPGKMVVCGEEIDFGQVKVPMYIYGSRDDHIVPIRGAYASTQVFPGKKRFVMGASGHIAGVINPPAKGKRHYWASDSGQFPVQWNEWVDQAEQQPGSWWPDWSQWLANTAGDEVAAPRAPGKASSYQAIEPAPGRYVKQRA